eukprot:SAG11_NODE_6607_length_1280_cov_1.183743_1_plen_150_part_10
MAQTPKRWMVYAVCLAGWPVHLISGQTCSLPTRAELSPDVVTRLCPPVSGPTGCGDGSAFEFIVRRGTTASGNENKVLVDFMGGGACWDYETCAEDTFMSVPFYTQLLDGRDSASARSLASNFGMDLNNIGLSAGVTAADVNTWTYVFVP